MKRNPNAFFDSKFRYGTVFSLVALMLTVTLNAESIPKKLMGDWTLDISSGEPGWLSVGKNEGQLVVRMRVYVGNEGPYKDVVLKNGRLSFTTKKSRKTKKGISPTETVDVGIENGKLDGIIHRTFPDGTKKIATFTGKRIPPMPTTAPDLSKVRFGKPISLFNGKDLSGWRLYETDKRNGWSVEDGMMVNTTPKTDFSATGAYANIRTEDVFEDFWLHIEFLVEEQRNSGVYLRGMYEAQVVDRDSRMQGLQGVGAIFSRIAPSVNAGKPGGEWQTYDITLVDRHVTVVLNGIKVIDNQPVVGPTGGAIHTDPMAPGPIYLQGDHTNVKYRDIYLAPVIRD